MWPDFRDIQDIKSVVFRISFGHQLNIQRPAWTISILNVIIQISLGEIWVIHVHVGALFSSHVLNALIRFEMVFDKVNLATLVDPLESVRAVAVHVPVAIGCSSI